MRAVIIGGAGLLGEGVAKDLVKREGMTKVVVADINVDGAKRVASEIGERAEAVYVDMNDHEGVVRVIKGANVVANITGPGYKYAPLMTKAAIEARVNYMDINDDAETIPLMLPLDQAAKDAGITVLSSAGVSPGLTNVYVRYVADRVDRVDDIIFVWVGSLPVWPTPARCGHRLATFGRQIPILRDGKVIKVPGFSDRETVEWPEPIGPVEAGIGGHAEPLMIPRYIKGVKNIATKASFVVKEFNELFVELGRLGFSDLEPIKVGNISIVPIEFTSHLLTSDKFKETEVYKRIMERGRAIGPCIGFKLEVKGEKAGKPVRYVYTYCKRHTNVYTYTAASIFAHMLASGKVQLKGVIFPEALDPKPIIDEVVKSNIGWEEEIET